MGLRRFLLRHGLLRFCRWFSLTAIVVIGIPLLLRSGEFNQLRRGSQLGDESVGDHKHDKDFPDKVLEGEKDIQKRGAELINGWDIDYTKFPKRNWHDQKLIDAESKRAGPGEQGKPVVLAKDDPEIKKKEDEIYRQNGFNGFVSDHIALNRSIKDIRHPQCTQQKHLSKLPTVSVVVPFHNEHWSTLLRTAHTIILRSPKDVLKQIILADDASTKEFLGAKLDEYVKKHLAPIVQIVRTKKREGLIRARQIGAQSVTSDIIVFLDSHSEPNVNWLPPLIEPIAMDYRTVVCPLVDVIDCDTFELRPQDEGARGSFDWEFNYKRLPLTEEDKKDPTKPFKSPVMAGGYFAIARKWFWELGGYDEGLDIWGGEQYELSFKVWQCHGQMVDAPCSRVGHIYRCKYVPFPNPGVGDFISRNYKRVAEVWMDEYKEHLYKRRPEMRNTDAGDMTKQKAVRERWNCKSFRWFMENIAFDQDKFYPAVEPPDGASGELRNMAKPQKCVDTKFKGKDERFGSETCLKDNPGHGGEQNIRLTWYKDIRPNKRSVCFDVSTSVFHAPVVLFPCHGMQGNQEWRYDPEAKQLKHPVSGLCLDCDAERGEIFMSECDSTVVSQQWQFEHVNNTVLDSWK